jgi:hypothetical protein
MTDRHLDTKAGVLRFCELRRREMAEAFMQEGRFDVNGYSFTGYVFATHEIRTPRNPERSHIDEWKTGPKLDHVRGLGLRMPAALGMVVPDSQITLLWSRVIREYTKLTRAIGTVIMSETWLVFGPAGTTNMHEYRDTLPDSLEDADNRQESLVMLLEHSAVGRKQWFSEIKRNPTRLEPWTEPDWADAEGRLTNLSDFRS